MSKYCIHCGKKLKNGELSYCESCYEELRTKGMFTTKKEKTSKK